MSVTAQRLRSVGWFATLLVCGMLLMVLQFRVNAVRSQVRQSEARIKALNDEVAYLDIEAATRAQHRQLNAWNDMEFGYTAPVSAQYLDNERQLAAYAKPIEPGAPAPVRVATADEPGVTDAAYGAMVSPLTGKPVGADHAPHVADAPPAHAGKSAAADVADPALADRLGTVHHAQHAVPMHGAAKHKADANKSDKTRTQKSHLASNAEAGPPGARRGANGPITLALREARAAK